MTDRDTFFDVVRDLLFGGSLTQSQVDGMTAILDGWETFDAGVDSRWIAYSLATAYWETGKKMVPVEELGKGRGRAYGKPAGPYKLVYYGRGLVQLTWDSGYKAANTWLAAAGFLSSGQDLEKNPDLALDPKIAVGLLIVGMVQGRFTGRKLADYFKGTRSDWVDARRIINGVDKAKLIAGFALHFYHALGDK
jgi:hypothetical protein